MRVSAFTVVMMSVLLATASAQAFPFGKKSDAGTATTATEDKTKSSSGVYLSDRFRALDTNHDGKVSQEEFMRDVTEQFKSRDANKDSSLSPDEFDFPPSTPEQMKTTLRNQLEQRETTMKKMRADRDARMQADIKRMRDEQDAARKKAATSAPAVTPPAASAPPAKTDEAKKEPPKTGTVPATATTARPLTYTSATAAETAAKPLTYTSSAPAAPVVPHTAVPAKKK